MQERLLRKLHVKSGSSLIEQLARAPAGIKEEDVASSVSNIVHSFTDRAKEEASKARSSAMKFAEAGLGSKSTEGEEPKKVYKVVPSMKGGLSMDPAPGQNAPTVSLRAQADYSEDVKQIGNFLGDHAYKDDVKQLLQEIDKDENFMKGLNLRIVEKENFLDDLTSRVDLLQTDVNKDKESMNNLRSHVKALRERIENIKKTKQLS